MSAKTTNEKKRPSSITLPSGIMISSYNGDALVAIETALRLGNIKPQELPRGTVCVRTKDGAVRWLSSKEAYNICEVLLKVTGYYFTYDGRNIILSIGGVERKYWPTDKPAGKDNLSWLRPLAEFLRVTQEDQSRMFPPNEREENSAKIVEQSDVKDETTDGCSKS
jgi:hypothetical protein